MPATEFVLVDISNSFTKVALSSRGRLGRIMRLPTKDLSGRSLRDLLADRRGRHAVVASVVPSRNPVVARVLPKPICWVSHKIALGVGIDYPKPETIGADRLANAVAAAVLYGSPAIVVDFGTAVTFDVVSAAGNYAGGVIAPGLSAMTDYLHKRTALLPRISLREPRQAIGRTDRGGHALRRNSRLQGTDRGDPAANFEGNSFEVPRAPHCDRRRCKTDRRNYRALFRCFASPYSGGAPAYWVPKFPGLICLSH